MDILIFIFRTILGFVFLLGYYLSTIMPQQIALSVTFFLVFLFPGFVYFLVHYFIKKLSRKTQIGVAVILLVGLSLTVYYCYASRAYHPCPLVFDGESTKLTKTQIVPTLDTPLQPGKNVIWCASFQGAWKTLQSDVAKGPVELEGAADVCTRLNDSPAPEAPEGALYMAAGWVQKGILDAIRREMAVRFLGSAVPEFPGVAADSFVAYGYLESKCKFTIPYFDSTGPLTFTDSAGNTTLIRTFGIRKQDGEPLVSG